VRFREGLSGMLFLSAYPCIVNTDGWPDFITKIPSNGESITRSHGELRIIKISHFPATMLCRQVSGCR
jgi:hypothetical protein